jgi:hypothetical protein
VVNLDRPNVVRLSGFSSRAVCGSWGHAVYESLGLGVFQKSTLPRRGFLNFCPVLPAPCSMPFAFPCILSLLSCIFLHPPGPLQRGNLHHAPCHLLSLVSCFFCLLSFKNPPFTISIGSKNCVLYILEEWERNYFRICCFNCI